MFSVLSLEGENQVGDKKEQSLSHRMVPQCSGISPKVTELEVAEGQSKKAMKLTKGRIADPLIAPNGPSQHILGDYKFVFKLLV